MQFRMWMAKGDTFAVQTGAERHSSLQIVSDAGELECVVFVNEFQLRQLRDVLVQTFGSAAPAAARSA